MDPELILFMCYFNDFFVRMKRGIHEIENNAGNFACSFL